MAKKTVLLNGHSGICKWNDVSEPWADVWVSLKHRRRKEYFAPCLAGTDALRRDVESARATLEREAAKPNNWRRISHALMESLREELREDQVVLSRLEVEGIVVVPVDDVKERMETVYSNKALIDKAEAERMLRVYLRGYGYNPDNIRFKWVKPKDISWAY